MTEDIVIQGAGPLVMQFNPAQGHCSFSVLHRFMRGGGEELSCMKVACDYRGRGSGFDLTTRYFSQVEMQNEIVPLDDSSFILNVSSLLSSFLSRVELLWGMEG